MVLIDSDEIMRLHVAHEVGGENHSLTNFPLYADIHFDRAGRAIVGIVHLWYQAEAETLVQQRSYVVRVGRVQIKRRVGLILLLKRSNLIAYDADGDRSTGGCAAEGWLELASWDGDWQRRRRAIAHKGSQDEHIAHSRAELRVASGYAGNDIFVEKPDATTDRSLAFASGVPGEAQLRGKVSVRLADLIAPSVRPLAIALMTRLRAVRNALVLTGLGPSRVVDKLFPNLFSARVPRHFGGFQSKFGPIQSRDK
jgi:hypothetical protein